MSLLATPALAINPPGVLLQARSLAFAPDFASSGHVFIAFEGRNGKSHVERYTRSATDQLVFDPARRRVVWGEIRVTVEHALGAMHFDRAGMLVVGIGENYQQALRHDLSSPLGKLVRIDPSGDDFPSDATRNHAIRADNPHAGVPGAAREVLPRGLRNPCRWSSDRRNGDLWIGDVGNQSWEEITWMAAGSFAGANLGWPYFEGVAPGLEALPPGFDVSSLTPPAWAFPHPPMPGLVSNSAGCAVTGGVVYRGSLMRAWRGRYFWVDWCRGRLHSGVETVELGRRVLRSVIDHTPMLGLPGGANFAQLGMNTISEDAQGELWIARQGRGIGKLYRVEPEAIQPALADASGRGGRRRRVSCPTAS